MRHGRLAFVGVLLAAAMAGAAVTVAYGLATGFDRAARQADLPDVIVRFRTESRDEIDRIVSALPDVAARSYRLEFTDVGVSARDGSSEKGSVALVDPGRRGYAIVDGRDVSAPEGELLVHALARNDVFVPTLCHDSKLDPYGGCRLCVVGVEGGEAAVDGDAASGADAREGLTAACTG